MVLVNQGLATMAFAGVEVNLVLFSKSVLRQTNAEAANTFSRWLGSMYLCSLVGAFLSDSYLGRFKTCVIFQVVFAIGLVSTALSTHLFLLKPRGCGKIGDLCEPHSPLETDLFYVSIYLVAIGNGAPEPALAVLGADQFDEDDPDDKQSKSSFYGYFYVALNMGCLVSETVLVYVENLGHWVPVFWACAGFSIVAYVLLLGRTARYRHYKPAGNPFSRFSQVIVASVRKMKLEVPEDGGLLYEPLVGGREEGNTPRKIHHTDGFKFLDRAAIITEEDRKSIQTESLQVDQNPWRLCTITQIEEVKCVLRLLPIWLCTILSSMVFIQMLSLFVEQGAAMDTRAFLSFHIPPASMTAIDIVSTSAFILLYDKLVVPQFMRLAKRKPWHPGELTRIGIGLAIAVVAMVLAGLVERRRLAYALLRGEEEEKSSLSIFWQTPQYVLVGISEVLVYVAQMEFFSSRSPETMKSIGMGLSMSSSAIGCYICSMILSVVTDVTSRGGRLGWVPRNLNNGHLDRFFFLSAALIALNLGFFMVCSRRYKSATSLEKRERDDEIETA
ncbi:hypothetical protein SAY87_024896 [Trapa incisa]|uniref:Uncharacterized protein n=1 Tax=Trapa incisa TaxID=236973 RepID=A0AAN7JGA3_9MYRT|nr:hypothetical protein SAY87_024896 [Trapa incisa]